MSQQPPASKATHEVTIYADGAASPNPGHGGYGVILIREGQRRELSGGFRKTTNNRMEIMGAIVGLRALGGQKSKVTIVSDSKYVVDMFNGGYAEKWRRANWTRNKGKDAALNPDLWNELLNLAAQHEVHFTWVRGHGSNLDNARCDELAVAARGRPGLPADTGYEKPGLPEPAKQLTFFDGLQERFAAPGP
jgi:ribonuclease HI